MPGHLTAAREAALNAPERDTSRRRLLLLSVAIMILLSTTPILGHHLVSGVGSLAADRDHFFGLCIVALQSLLSPVHEGFHLLLWGGLLYALFDRIRAGRELRQVLRSLPATAPGRGSAFERAANRARQSVESIRVVEELPTPAFTAGWWRPRIFLAAQLERLLTEEELAAVIRHESAHAARRDPLKLSIMRFVASTLFYIPALRRMADDLADETEIDADDSAAGSDPGVLASAIVALARFDTCSTRSRPLQICGFASRLRNCGLLERRVRRLVGEHATARTHLTRPALAWAMAALVAIWISGISTALAAAPGEKSAIAGDHTQHCRHNDGLLSHLFCPGGTPGPSPVRCAHNAA